MEKIRLVILKNETEDDHELWLRACRERAQCVEWQEVDLTRHDWLEKIMDMKVDGLLTRPPATTNSFKRLYDERVGVLNLLCGIPVYPSLEEVLIYENKKHLSYWLSAMRIPHAKTLVFYFRDEALEYVREAKLPLVGKTNIGASGRGVKILRSKEAAIDYVKQTFSSKGASQSIGPNLNKKGLLRRAVRKIMHPAELKARLSLYRELRSDIQNQYVILQEYVPHTYEWRCVRIGDSFFAHKKIVVGEKASGTLVKGYENPPLDLLDFVREVTDRRGFLSQSVDLFETDKGQYLVNEMQCMFGQSDPYQMLVDGKPGRYRYLDDQWTFEPGDFNRHESFLLRLDHFLSILKEPKPV